MKHGSDSPGVPTEGPRAKAVFSVAVILAVGMSW